jgi:hydroxymethylbilane synthase
LQKLAENGELDAIVLAAAGLARLKFAITAEKRLDGDAAPAGLVALPFDHKEMLPCVGQGAIGLEIREQDERIALICQCLNHGDTLRCVTAERSLLREMGGGCQTPIGAYAQVTGANLHLQAVSFLESQVRRAEGTRPVTEAAKLGEEVAAQLRRSR